MWESNKNDVLLCHLPFYCYLCSTYITLKLLFPKYEKIIIPFPVSSNDSIVLGIMP